MERRQFLIRSSLAAAGLAASGLRLRPARATAIAPDPPSTQPPAAPLGPTTRASDGTLSVDAVTGAPCLWGVHIQCSGQDTYAQTLQKVESMVGRKFATHRRNYPWKHPLTTSLDASLAKGGRYPLVSWLARTGGGSSISWKRIAGGAEDSWIRRQAGNAKSFGYPIYLVFHHEPENDPGQPQDFKAAFQRIHTIFQNVGTPNVRWVLALMAVTYKGAHGGPAAWYPGDFIDLIGGDGYNWFPSRPWRKWEPFDGIFRGLHEFGVKKNRPTFVVEFGCQEDTDCGNSGGDPSAKADWFYASEATIKSWKEMRAVSYSNTTHNSPNGLCDTDWRINSSNRALTAYKNVGLDSYFK